MSLSVHLDTPVRLFAATIPSYADGRVVALDGDRLELVLDQPLVSHPGDRIIVAMGAGESTPRVILEVQISRGDHLIGRIAEVPAPEKREYPRLEGLVRVRYRLAGDHALNATWLRGDPVDGVDHEPDPFMNFSATGLAFDDLDGPPEGGLLLCEVRLPGRADAFRCTARVVRVATLSAADREVGSPYTCNVAVFFEDIPVEATIALAAYTLQLQEALLGPEA